MGLSVELVQNEDSRETKSTSMGTNAAMGRRGHFTAIIICGRGKSRNPLI
jgi:hypothetical protein